MNRLDAVKYILRHTGSRPVSALDTNGASLGAEAERFLDDAEIRVQAEGYHYNVRRGVELTPDVNNKLAVPAGVLWIDSDHEDARKDVVQNGGFLYDRTENQFTFDGVLKTKFALRLGFECIPIKIRFYIVAKAARMFNAAHGPRSRDAQLEREEFEARMGANAYELEASDLNVLDQPEVRELKGDRFNVRNWWAPIV